MSKQWKGGVPPVPSMYQPNAASGRPGSVTTAGVLAMMFGIIGTLGGAILVAAASNADLRRDSSLSEHTARIVGVGALVICLAMVIVGRLVLKGRRWARWVLTVLFAVGVATILSGGVDSQSLVSLVFSALIVLMLWTPKARRWFAAQR